MSDAPHTISQFQVAMQQVHGLTIKVGELVTEQVVTALDALHAGDTEKAQKVAAKDEKVDELEKEVDKACAEILARYSPVAGDLRMIIVILKAITDLERIGDEASNIAEQAGIREKIPPKVQGDIKVLGDDIVVALRQLVTTFGGMNMDHEDMNLDQSRDLVAEDKEINRQADKLIETALSGVFGDAADNTQNILSVIWCIRSLERIGDHIKNIGQYLIYFAEGVDIRH